MKKRNSSYDYSSISSFEELRLEKERLRLKSRLVRSKIDMDYIQIREVFSIPALIENVSSKFIPTEIYQFLERIFKN